MRFACDRTGFPVLELPDLSVEMQLLPMTKWQFEQFLAQPESWGDAWYESVLALNPRVSWRRFTRADQEGLLLTALLPAEVEAFVPWMGAGWSVPSPQCWQRVYRRLLDRPLTQDILDALPKDQMNPAAVAIVRSLLRELAPRTVAEFCLLRGGVLEWVRDDTGGWGGLGVPRAQFASVLVDPLGEPLRPIRETARIPYFGLRLFRSGRDFAAPPGAGSPLAF